jgi:hypothetical protein
MEVQEVSFVSIDDDLVRKVAERCQTDEARVRAYLASEEQDNTLLSAFLFFGVGPINKRFQEK